MEGGGVVLEKKYTVENYQILKGVWNVYTNGLFSFSLDSK